MKTVDLSKVKIEMLGGEITEHNVAKELAEVIFRNTQSISEHSFCMELYKNPIIELSEENRLILNKYIKQYFKAFIQIAIDKILEEE